MHVQQKEMSTIKAMPEHSLNSFSDLAKSLLGKEKIRTVVEVGARDCVETLEFSRLFPGANIYAFECNPSTLPLCRKNIKGRRQIHLIEMAITDKPGTVSFYPINTEKTRTTWKDGNPGASSLFRASGKYPVEDYVQDEITVKATTLRDFMESSSLNSIDLMWMDIQGAELLALKGAGKRIRSIKLLHLEVGFMEIYSGQPLYSDLKKFLNHRGFLLIGFTNFGQYSADAVFVNVRSAGLLRIPKLLLKDRSLYWWKSHKPGLVERKVAAGRLSKRSLMTLGRPVRRFLTLLARPWEKASNIKTSLSVKNMPLFSARRIFCYVLLRRVKPLLNLDPNLKPNISSDVPLDVVIPVADKDLGVLKQCVEGLRLNLMHPIGTIFLVAPNSAKIKKVAKEIGCKFIDETTILPIAKAKINYRPKGINRAGWVCQQFIKYNAGKLASHDNYLAIDSDTVLVKPQILIQHDKPKFNHSDEYHLPYYEAYKKLLNEVANYPLSFVSHHMIFNKKILGELKNKIELKHNKPWFEAILDSMDIKEFSAVSEYETYGNYYTSHYPAVHLYWFNKLVPVGELDSFDELLSMYSSQYKALSFHTHEKL